MPHQYPKVDKRECPRIVVEIPVTIWSAQGSGMPGKIIDLSAKGGGIIFSMLQEINSELELRFHLPSDADSPELRIRGKVRHNYEILPTAGTPADYLYVVGVEFLRLGNNEKAQLDAFVGARPWPKS